MKANSSYQNYLQNQEFQSYPNNIKIRIKSGLTLDPRLNQQNKPDSIKLKQPYSKTTHKQNYFDSKQPNHQTDHQEYNFVSHPRSYRVNLQIPYDTQQLNRNMSKVLTQIQQIQSQFRLGSSKNSMYLKLPNQKYQSAQDSNFLQSLINKIKKTVNYQQKNNTQIFKQKQKLVKIVKNLNTKLNQKIYQVQRKKQKSVRRASAIQSKLQRKRKIKTQIDQSLPKRNQRTPSALQFQKQLVQIVQQINSNNKLIQNMKKEFEFLNKKFEGYQNSLKNYKIQQLIKLKKQEISRIRKKKFINQKAIMSIQKRNGNIFGSNSKDILSTNCSTSTHSSQVLVSLKQEYSEFVKKRQKLKDKIQLTKMHLNRIQELKDKNNVSKQHYQSLMEQIKNLNLDNQQSTNKPPNPISLSKNIKNPSQINKQPQHIQFIYKARKSKLLMLMNTIKRSQQSYKRKYYNLLKQYQAMVDDDQNSIYSSKISPSSPSKPKTSILKIYKENQKIFDQKLALSKQQITKLQNKIQRFKKVGKIMKKVNHLQSSQQLSQLNQSNNFQNHSDQYDMQFQSQQEQMQSENNLKQSKSSTKKRIQNQYNEYVAHGPLIKQNMKNLRIATELSLSKSLKPSQRRTYRSLQRIIIPASQYKTPFRQQSRKQYQFSEQENRKRYLTQDDRSFTTDINSGLDKSAIKFDTNQSSQNKNNRKYIGKFKKQRIIQKIDKKHIQKDYSPQKQKSQASIQKYKSQTPIQKYKCQTPIIQQQIQGTSEYDTMNKVQTLGQQVQFNKKKIKFVNNHNKYQNQFDQSFDQQINDQLMTEMQELSKQVEKQIREDQVKTRLSQILYKSKLFS